MAQKKLKYSWNKVKPGDIISFRYKSKSGSGSKTQTILVLNPRLSVKLKNGKSTKHLIGIKIEENNKPKLKMTSGVEKNLNKIGEVGEITVFKADLSKKDDIKLDDENSNHKWIKPEKIGDYDFVLQLVSFIVELGEPD